MKRPTANIVFLYKKLGKLRDTAEVLITQLLSPLEHHSFSILTVFTLLYTNHNITTSNSCIHSLVTGWVVVLTCYISHSAKYRKKPVRELKPKPILMKLGVVDYVQDPTPLDNFAGSSMWVLSAQM